MPKGPSAPRLNSRPLAVSGAGVVGVLLIHALLVLPFVLNLSLPLPRHPSTTGAGATAFLSSAEPDMTVVFIDEPTPPESAAPPKPPAVASRGITPPDLPLVVLSPDPSPATASEKAAESDDAAGETMSAADAAEHARLYGRYVGQVQARIERAWRRPRSEIGAPRFSCRVRIRQDRRGRVVEVTLHHCNGTELWQQSLLSAIRTASPLPAPPDASVYADVLWLSVSSEGFEKGGSTQGFEPETRTESTTERNVLESFQRFASGAYGDRKSDDKRANVVHLTIIGAPMDRSAPSRPPAEPPPLPESQLTELPPR